MSRNHRQNLCVWCGPLFPYRKTKPWSFCVEIAYGKAWGGQQTQSDTISHKLPHYFTPFWVSLQKFESCRCTYEQKCFLPSQSSHPRFLKLITSSYHGDFVLMHYSAPSLLLELYLNLFSYLKWPAARPCLFTESFILKIIQVGFKDSMETNISLEI